VLELLLERAGDIVPRQELLDRVWKDAFVTDTSLAEAVSVLRQTLGDDPQSPSYVQTVHRRGYRFVSPVTRAGAEAPHHAPAPAEPPGRAEVVRPSLGRELIPWSAAILSAAVATTAVWQLTAARDSSAPTRARFTIAAAGGTSFDDRAPAVAVSSDATQLAWSACDAAGCRLYLRPLDQLEPRQLAGTDGAYAPFFSPDGESIGFFADGRLKKIAVDGGEPVTLADAAEPLGGTWAGRDIIFAAGTMSGLLRIPEGGGRPQTLTVPASARGEVRHSWPAAVPGGRTLLFTIEGAPGGVSAGSLGALSLEDARASWRTLLAGVGLVMAAAPDVVVFSRGADLQAVPFDPLRLTLAGEPRTVASNVSTADGRAHVALSSGGDLLFVPGERGDARRVAWWSRAGIADVAADTRRLRYPRLAPDGRRIAAVGDGESRTDVWVADLDRGAATRLTYDRINSSPVWGADGRTVFFASRDGGAFEIWSRDADGASPPKRVLRSDSHAFPGAASPDRSTLAVVLGTSQGGTDIFLLPLAGGPPSALVQSPFDDDAPAFSPDGSLLAYQSAETGRWQVYVHRLRDGRRAVVSTGGGERPVWSRDGSAIYYATAGGLARTAVRQTPDGLSIGNAEPLPVPPGARIAGIAADGRILLDSRAPAGAARATLALGWLRDVRQIIGPATTVLPR
jgi:serine/threonine-protein kinase